MIVLSQFTLQEQLLMESKALLLSVQKETGFIERLWVSLTLQHPAIWSLFRGTGLDRVYFLRRRFLGNKDVEVHRV